MCGGNSKAGTFLRNPLMLSCGLPRSGLKVLVNDKEWQQNGKKC